MTIESLLFWIFALITCGSAVAVVVAQDVVRMAFWLVMSLGSVAALFFLLGADFLGATQLLIYVGGTVVLLVFGVMLTASGPYLQIKTSPAEMFLGAGIGGLLLMVLGFSVVGVNWDEEVFGRLAGDQPRIASEINQEGGTARPLGLAFLGLRPDRAKLSAEGTSDRAGYLLPFEIVSVHLLVVLVGAAYLARAKRRVDGEQKV
jgi:NADH:ubiquinone oxidoreductase subunit 6 (subunit J)